MNDQDALIERLRQRIIALELALRALRDLGFAGYARVEQQKIVDAALAPEDCL